MGGRDGACHDMNLCFQPDTGHADRVLNAGLFVDDVFLGQDVDDLPIHGYGDGTRCVDDTINIGLRNFRAFNGDNATAVEAGDVSTGDAGIYG